VPLALAVCMKQVPNVARIRFDPETRRVVREGVAGLMDSFENRALGFAAGYVAEHGGSFTAITMGPPQAREILEQALALGAARALHLNDRAFAGADTLATARALAAALAPSGYDLILCGRHSTDSETGQVGPEVAELLGIPHLSGVRTLAIDEGGRSLTAERETDDGVDLVQCPLPALVTVSEGIGEEVWPRQEQLDAIDAGAISALTAADLGPPERFGAAGSPTWVGEVYEERPTRLGEVLSGDDPAALAEALVERLIARGAFARPAGDERPRARQRPPERGQAVLVWVELHDGRPRPSAFELLGAAGEIADAIGGHTVAMMAGGDTGDTGDIEVHERLAAYGADVIVRLPRGESGGLATEVDAVQQAIADLSPFAVLLPASAQGRDLAPRVAARLGVGLTGDCIGLRVDEQSRLVMLKPAFGGNIVAPVYSTTVPAMATVRPGLLAAPEPLPHPTVTVRSLSFVPSNESEVGVGRVRLLESRPDPNANVSKLTEAPIVVGVGRGLGGPENLPAIRALAAELQAEIGATRVVTDLGWLPRQRQIGLTGRAVAPSLYVAVGVSGSFNHMVGVLKAGTIVAINRSPRAPIAKTADYTLVGDWGDLVPALIAALARARGRGRLLL